MLITIFTVFLQFQEAIAYSDKISGNRTTYVRGLDRLSWIDAHASCANMSNTILPGRRVKHALRSLCIGEVAWTDGKEYTFCLEKNTTDHKQIIQECKYVTIRREDKREKLAYICGNDKTYFAKDQMMPYADAVQVCSVTKDLLLTVNSFVLPMLLPVNRTFWIGEYHDVRDANRLSPGQKVTELCTGIVKLDHDNFEFGTTSCDENHTVICDASGVDTAQTLAIWHEMMPSLENLKDKTASYQQKDDGKKTDSWSILYTVSTVLVLFKAHPGI